MAFLAAALDGASRRCRYRFQPRGRGARVARVSRHRQRASRCGKPDQRRAAVGSRASGKHDAPYGGTMAPLVVGDLVIAGVSGGDEGIRGFLAAYRVDTGEQAWRFWTVPARGEPASDTWKGSVGSRERRRRDLADRELRRRRPTRSSGLREIHIRTPTAASGRGTTCTRIPSSRSTRRPESCAGTISSRRTICGIGTRRSRWCSSTRCSRGGRESCCFRRIATASSMCSIVSMAKCCSRGPSFRSSPGRVGLDRMAVRSWWLETRRTRTA